MTDFFAEYRRQLQAIAPGDLGASVELLIEALPPHTAQMFRLCAIPHQVDRDLLPVLDPSVTSVDVMAIWEGLTRLSAVRASENGVALHDDVRAYLFGRWLEPARRHEFTAVSARLVEHFSRIDSATRGHQRMFHRLGANRDAGFEEFEELCRRARRDFRLDDCEKLIALVREYRGWLTGAQEMLLLYHEGKLHSDRFKTEAAENAFEAVVRSDQSPPGLRAKALNRLGMLSAQRRNWSTAAQRFGAARKLADADGSLRPVLGRILHEWGVAIRDKGDLEISENLLTQGVQIAEEASDWLGASVGYNSLGTLYRQRGDFRKAIDSYQISLRHLLEHGERFRPAQIHNNLGMALADAGEWQESERELEKSLDVKRQAGDTRGQAVSLSNLVQPYWNLGRQADAVRACNQASELFLQVNDFYRAALTKRDAARLERNLGHKASSDAMFAEAIRLFEAAGRKSTADATHHEHANREVGLPWWLWTAMVLLVIIVILLIAIFVVVEV